MTKKEKIEDSLLMIKMALNKGNYKLLKLLQNQLQIQLEMYLKNILKDGTDDK